MSDQEWVVNTDTTCLVPVTRELHVQPPLEPYEPTEEEIKIGRALRPIVHVKPPASPAVPEETEVVLQPEEPEEKKPTKRRRKTKSGS